MAKYPTWIVYLLYICAVVGPVWSQTSECCLYCDQSSSWVTVTRQQRKRIVYPQLPNTTCEYRLQPTGSREFLSIETSSFRLVDSVGCREEYVEIFEDASVANEPGGKLHSIGRWCGQSHAKEVNIRGKVRIRLKIGEKAWSIGLGGFRMYVVAKEESFYTLDEHHNTVYVDSSPVYIYSPGYPGQYPSTLRMNWNLIGRDSSQLINVEAIEFQMEEEEDETGLCKYDNLTLSTMPQSNETAVWCGRSASRFFQSHQNVELLLRTDRSQTAQGFALRVYTTSVRNTSCLAGGVRTVSAYHKADLLSLTPLLEQRRECSWLIQSERSNDVILLEVITWDEDVLVCGDRPLQVHDGSDDEGTQLVSKCGSLSPFGFIRTSGSAAYITSGLIISRPEVLKHGFKIKYSSVYKYYYGEEYHEAVKSRSFMWIPVLTEAIQRPDIKFRSDPFHRCVHVEVQTKWLHQVKGSYLDYVEVYDGTGYRARLMGVCSGAYTSSISGTLDTLEVRIKTPVKEGFWLTVDTTGNCDGDIEILRVTDTDQRLTFPTPRMLLNRFFPSNTECTWRLEKSISTGLIHVDVLEMQLSTTPRDRCQGAHSYLEAYNGQDPTHSKVDTWCDSHYSNVTSLIDLKLKVRVKDFLSDRKFTVSYWMDTTC